MRQIESRLPTASPVFKLAYTGSVGSQAFLGIARLEKLRRKFPNRVAIWPFETDFAENLSAPVICAEIYPSAHTVSNGPKVKDQRQVEAVLRDFSEWNADGQLHTALRAPKLRGNQRTTVLNEEGWVIGV